MTMAPTTTMRETEGVPAGAATTSTKAAASKHHMNLFDLANVGLSSTLAIAIFIGSGYAVRHVAGPSAIVSILIAAILAYLVGKFSEATNGTYLLKYTEWSKWQARHAYTHTAYSQHGLRYRLNYNIYIDKML